MYYGRYIWNYIERVYLKKSKKNEFFEYTWKFPTVIIPEMFLNNYEKMIKYSKIYRLKKNNFLIKKSLFKLRRILKLELLWTLIPVIVLLLLGIPAFVFFFGITPWLSTFVMVVKSIHIVGNQWYWDVILEAISDDFYL